MNRTRARLLLLCAVLGLIAAAAGAASAIGSTRAVDVLSIFAGGFGAGAALVSALYELRKLRGPVAAQGH